MPLATYAELLDRVRGLRWPARRAVLGAGAGAHRARARTLAPELTEYRPYRQGDDPRALDYKLLARSDRAYVRLAEARAPLPLALVLDASASLDFPADGAGKWRLAAELAVLLAAVAHGQGDAVGLTVATADGVRRLAPRSRRGVVSEIALTLASIRPGGSPALAPAVAEAAAHAPGARLVVVSDFLGDDAAQVLRLAARHVAAGAESHAAHVVAREELEPPVRSVLAADPERADVRRPLGAESRAEYQSAFARWRGELAGAWRGAGAGYTQVATDEPADRIVRRVIAPVGA